MSRGFDLVAAAQWLRRQGIELEEQVSASRLGGGNSNMTYLFGLPGKAPALVLRHPPLTAARASAYVKREYGILVGLSATEVPAPRPVALCTEPSVAGAPFLVMKYLPGTVIESQEEARELSPEARGRVGTSLVQCLADIHAIDPDSSGLGDIGPRTSYAERQIARWAPRWIELGGTSDRLVGEMTDYLRMHMPTQVEHRLVHGDFSLGNVLIGSSGSVTGVIDWELSTLGDPLADLATLLTYWPDVAGAHPATDDDVTLEAGFVRQAELVEGYALASGRDLAALPYFRVLAYWRLAIIIQGVHRRWKADPATVGPGAARLGAKSEKLVELGHAAMLDARNMA